MNRTVNSKQGLRQRWLAVHLYLGLFLGALAAIAGLTGSLLVFYQDLDQQLNPELVVSDQLRSPLSYEALFQALRQAEPHRSHGWRLEIPQDANQAMTARYYKPAETEHLQFAPLLLSVDPYNGEVVAKRFWGQFAMTWIYDLHYQLLLDGPGKILMALVGVLLLVSIVSGIYLWWPPAHKWRAALSVKLGAKPERVNYDLHKVAGVYSMLLMLLLSLTGIALEIPEYFNPFLGQISPLRAMPKPQSHSPQAGQRRISLDQAVAEAKVLYPNARLCWIETPHDATGSYRINLRQDFEPSVRFPKTNVWIDQYSGAVLDVNDPRVFSAGDTVLAWLHALHSGEALGLTGRCLVLLTGLLCPLMYVTGLIRWQQKRKIRLSKKQVLQHDDYRHKEWLTGMSFSRQGTERIEMKR